MAKISVIIPTYNRIETLPRAVNSVLNQSLPADELIVVDDGSTDGTAEWLIQQPQVKAFYQENSGVSAARNLAIRDATGDWIAFLDSDDEWLPEKLQKQMEWIQAHPEHKIVHGEEIWIRNGRRVNARRKHQKSGGWIFTKCLPLCLISPSAVMIHRSVFDHVGLFDEDYPVCEDYDLWLRITANYEVGYIEDPIINKYGGHTDQLSRKFFAMDYWRIKSLSRILEGRILEESLDGQSPTTSPNKKLNERLSEEEFETIIKVIAEKSEILLKGYIKHSNLDHFDEVKALSQKAQAFSAASKTLNL